MLWLVALWTTLAASALAAAGSAAGIPGLPVDLLLWENSHYYRTVELGSPYVREQVLVEIRNTSPTPQDTYVFPVNDGLDAVHNVSYVVAQTIEPKQRLDFAAVADGVYTIKFPYPIAPGNSVKFQVTYVYIGRLAPFPAKIGMADTQLLLYRGNKFCFSPYPTRDYALNYAGLARGQEMEIAVADSVQTSSGLPELVVTANTESHLLTYGPTIDGVPPYSVVPMGLAYDYNRPLTRALLLERSFWLPATDHGKIQTEDYYELTNTGAALKDGFSRVDWMKGRYEAVKDHHALSQLEYPFTPQAPFLDYHFTDKVGMVLSHQVIHEHVVFQPRYPLFGGWHYNFTMGWSSAVGTHVRLLRREPSTYVAKFPLLPPLRNIVYDNVSVSFYLPENAEFVNATAIIAEDSLLVGAEATYLDVENGHVKVTLHYRNLHDALSQMHVYVKYRYSAASYWRKVFKIAAFAFTGFASYYALGLVDISIKS